MSSSYRYARDWENQQKWLFTDYDVAGDYDIPIIKPEYDFHSGKRMKGFTGHGYPEIDPKTGMELRSKNKRR